MLAFNAYLLLHDAQYTSEEYRHKHGLVHSSTEDAAKFAALAKVKHLLFSHSDPSHNDDQLKEIFRCFEEKCNCKFKYEQAVEGMIIEL